MPTDPTGFSQSLQDKNVAENFQIKRLVRLVKYWNASNGSPYTSFSLERYIVGKYFYSCTSLKDYYYAFWSDFNYEYSTAQYIKNKIDTAKKYVTNAKNYESSGMPIAAENEIKKMVPAL